MTTTPTQAPGKDFTEGYAGPVRAPRGTEITAANWLLEAPRRMLLNNLDPEVAEAPEQLVVYGGTGRAARSWEAMRAILRALETMAPDETLCVQSGKPVAIFKTHEDAPRVLIANSHLVPHWATRDEHARLEALGLTMYGQMTAGSWIYIGSPGHSPGHFRDPGRVRAGTQLWRRPLKGTLTCDRRPRRHGRSPAPGSDHERRCHVPRSPRSKAHRIDRRLETRLSSIVSHRRHGCSGVDEALEAAARRPGRRFPSACRGQHRSIYSHYLIERGVTPRRSLTDQTSSAHDNRHRLRAAWSWTYEARPRHCESQRHQGTYVGRRTWPVHGRRTCALMLELQEARRPDLRLRQQPERTGPRGPAGSRTLSTSQGFVPAFHPSALLRSARARSGGWRSVGRSRGHLRVTDEAHPRDLFPKTRTTSRPLDPPGSARSVAVSGAAGPHLLAGLRRAGELRPRVFNELVASRPSSRPRS